MLLNVENWSGDIKGFINCEPSGVILTNRHQAVRRPFTMWLQGWLSPDCLIYPHNEPPEARPGKYYSAGTARCCLGGGAFTSGMRHCVYVATRWLWWTIFERSPTVAPLIGLSLTFLIKSLVTHSESGEGSSRWVYCPLIRPAKDLGCRSWGQMQSDPLPRARMTLPACISSHSRL